MTAERRGRRPWRRPATWFVPLVLAGGFVATGTGTSAPPGREGRAVSAEIVARSDTTPPAQAAVRRAPRAQATLGCERCHGELELLRQQAGTLARARELLVPDHVVAGSAHGDMSCAECHTGYGRYPHEERGTRTQTCASCHAAADTLWRLSTHAAADDQVTCVQCHGAHDISAAATLRSKPGAQLANAPCESCHEANRLPLHAPHADSVSCASCHAPHDTRTVDDPDSWLSPARQLATCAACHEEVAARWRTDIHGDSELRRAHLAGREPAAETVLCTSCHTGHEMRSGDDPAFALASVERCSACHEHGARTFYNSYHGRATVLGSRVSASCADCHGAHDILPDSFPASRVAHAKLVATCGECHEHARPAFVKYDSHPDPFNRARNPWIFYSFFVMNGLLVFVLVVFGGHTLLWWLRLWLDKRRGISHGIGVHGHEHGYGQEEGGQA